MPEKKEARHGAIVVRGRRSQRKKNERHLERPGARQRRLASVPGTKNSSEEVTEMSPPDSIYQYCSTISTTITI